MFSLDGGGEELWLNKREFPVYNYFDIIKDRYFR